MKRFIASVLSLLLLMVFTVGCKPAETPKPAEAPKPAEEAPAPAPAPAPEEEPAKKQPALGC